MAGSDQSVNLGGMLTNISDTIGGMSAAGKGYNDAFINAFKPQIDPSSPESLQAAAQWASNNGRQEEALAYRKEANAASLRNTEKDAEERERKIGEQLSVLSAEAQEQAAAGDKEGLMRTKAKADALMQGAPLAAQDQIRETSKGIAEMAPAAASKGAANMATSIREKEARLSDPAYRAKLGEDKAAAIESRIDEALMSSPETLKAYNQQMEAEAVRTAQQKAASEAEQLKLDTAEVLKLISEDDLDGAMEKASKMSNPDVVKPYIELKKSRIDLANSKKKENPENVLKFTTADAEDALASLSGFEAKGIATGAAGFQKRIDNINNNTEMSAEYKASQMAAVRDDIFKQQTTLINEEHQRSVAETTDRNAKEKKAATSRPSKDQVESIKQELIDAKDTWYTVEGLIDIASDQEIRLIHSDILRNQMGLPTTTYQIENGMIVFDKDGDPALVDPNAAPASTDARTALAEAIKQAKQKP